MALPYMGGLERSCAFTVLHDAGMPCESSDVTELLASYDAWLADRPVQNGATDLWTYGRERFHQADEPAVPYIPVETSLVRDEARSTRAHAPFKLAFTKRFDELSASTNVEWLTQGELIELWQQIGAQFHLGGM